MLPQIILSHACWNGFIYTLLQFPNPCRSSTLAQSLVIVLAEVFLPLFIAANCRVFHPDLTPVLISTTIKAAISWPYSNIPKF